MSAVRCRGLVRARGATPVLRGLDLDIAPGEKVAILGPNGSGKTTLIGVLAGLLAAQAGEVHLWGGSPEDPRVRRRVGLLAHNPSLYPRLTALENARFWARMYGADGGRGGALLASLGLDPADARPVDTYSQGMRRRAGLACALVHDPDLLLSDEPFAGLDDRGADAVERLLAEPGRTLVLATHEADRAAGIGCRLLRLDGGRLREAVGLG